MLNQHVVEQKKELSIGDIVRLNSGSPDLRVIAIPVKSRVTVEWHTATEREELTASQECFYSI
jgi:hypothetical protein